MVWKMFFFMSYLQNPKMWCKAVWKEGSMEMEGVVPSEWIDRQKLLVRWPPGPNAMKAMKERRLPTEKWSSFPLMKIKYESGTFI